MKKVRKLQSIKDWSPKKKVIGIGILAATMIVALISTLLITGIGQKKELIEGEYADVVAVEGYKRLTMGEDLKYGDYSVEIENYEPETDDYVRTSFVLIQSDAEANLMTNNLSTMFVGTELTADDMLPIEGLQEAGLEDYPLIGGEDYDGETYSVNIKEGNGKYLYIIPTYNSGGFLQGTLHLELK